MASAAEEAEAKRVREGWRAAARDALYWSSSPSRPLCRRAERRQGDTLQELQKKGRSRAGRNKHAVTLSRTRIRRRASVVLSDFCSSRNELRRASGEDDDGGRCRRRHGRRRERRRRGGTTINQAGERTGGRARKTFLPPNSRSRLGKFNVTGSATNCDPCSLIFALWFCQSSNSGFAQFSYFRKREK